MDKLNKESRSISQSKSSKLVKSSNIDINLLNIHEFKKTKSVLNIDQENNKILNFKSSYTNIICHKIHKDKSEESLILMNNKSKFSECYNKIISIINDKPNILKHFPGVLEKINKYVNYNIYEYEYNNDLIELINLEQIINLNHDEQTLKLAKKAHYNLYIKIIEQIDLSINYTKPNKFNNKNEETDFDKLERCFKALRKIVYDIKKIKESILNSKLICETNKYRDLIIYNKQHVDYKDNLLQKLIVIAKVKLIQKHFRLYRWKLSLKITNNRFDYLVNNKYNKIYKVKNEDILNTKTDDKISYNKLIENSNNKNSINEINLSLVNERKINISDSISQISFFYINNKKLMTIFLINKVFFKKYIYRIEYNKIKLIQNFYKKFKNRFIVKIKPKLYFQNLYTKSGNYNISIKKIVMIQTHYKIKLIKHSIIKKYQFLRNNNNLVTTSQQIVITNSQSYSSLKQNSICEFFIPCNQNKFTNNKIIDCIQVIFYKMKRRIFDFIFRRDLYYDKILRRLKNILSKEFEDMPEYNNLTIGKGVKCIKAYKCNLDYNQLTHLRERFWANYKYDNVIKKLKVFCQQEIINEDELNKENIICIRNCLNFTKCEMNYFYLPNFIINDPFSSVYQYSKRIELSHVNKLSFNNVYNYKSSGNAISTVNLRKENYKYSYDLFIANFYKSINRYKKRISKEILIEFKLYYIKHRTILDKSTIRRLDSEERDSLSVCSNSSFNYSKSFKSEELFENHTNEDKIINKIPIYDKSKLIRIDRLSSIMNKNGILVIKNHFMGINTSCQESVILNLNKLEEE